MKMKQSLSVFVGLFFSIAVNAELKEGQILTLNESIEFNRTQFDRELNKSEAVAISYQNGQVFNQMHYDASANSVGCSLALRAGIYSDKFEPLAQGTKLTIQEMELVRHPTRGGMEPLFGDYKALHLMAENGEHYRLTCFRSLPHRGGASGNDEQQITPTVDLIQQSFGNVISIEAP